MATFHYQKRLCLLDCPLQWTSRVKQDLSVARVPTAPYLDPGARDSVTKSHGMAIDYYGVAMGLQAAIDVPADSDLRNRNQEERWSACFVNYEQLVIATFLFLHSQVQIRAKCK